LQFGLLPLDGDRLGRIVVNNADMRLSDRGIFPKYYRRVKLFTETRFINPNVANDHSAFA
jgi:hypothetical protein